MSESLSAERAGIAAQETREADRRDRSVTRSWIVEYAAVVFLVGAATVTAAVLEPEVGGPNLTLVYVLPVVIASAAFGWGPALAAIAAGLLAYDFFFTEPRYSLEIAGAAEFWTAGLLLGIATLVSAVAAEARRRTLQARAEADRAETLQALARMVIERRSRGEVFQAGVETLHQIFEAPAVVLEHRSGALVPVAAAGALKLTPADEEAAHGAFAAGVPVRSETYPFEASVFDFWPVPGSADRPFVVGVEFHRTADRRPAAPERLAEMVAAWLGAACGRDDRC